MGTTILWAGLASVLAGGLLGILAILGFRHAATVPGSGTEQTITIPELADATN